MVKVKSKRRMVSLRLTATFVLAGLVISLFLSQTAAAADTDEALWFDPFNLQITPRMALSSRGSGGAGGLVSMGYVPPPRIPYRPPLRSPFRPPI